MIGRLRRSDHAVLYSTTVVLHMLGGAEKTLRRCCLDDWFEGRCLNSGLSLYESPNHHFVTFVIFNYKC